MSRRNRLRLDSINFREILKSGYCECRDEPPDSIDAEHFLINWVIENFGKKTLYIEFFDNHPFRRKSRMCSSRSSRADSKRVVF
jgi:hypothetical protein